MCSCTSHHATFLPSGTEWCTSHAHRRSGGDRDPRLMWYACAAVSLMVWGPEMILVTAQKLAHTVEDHTSHHATFLPSGTAHRRSGADKHFLEMYTRTSKVRPILVAFPFSTHVNALTSLEGPRQRNSPPLCFVWGGGESLCFAPPKAPFLFESERLLQIQRSLCGS